MHFIEPPGVGIPYHRQFEMWNIPSRERSTNSLDKFFSVPEDYSYPKKRNGKYNLITLNK